MYIYIYIYPNQQVSSVKLQIDRSCFSDLSSHRIMFHISIISSLCSNI